MQNQQNTKSRESNLSDKHIVEEKCVRSGKIINRYAKGRLLGKGGFAKCYQFLCLNTNQKYAAKIIEKSSLNRSKAKQKLTSQIKIHKSLVSSYVVGFEHFFEDPENVYILLELCPNQTLNELIKRRKRILELEAKYYVYQIASALKDIHGQQVIHRDLKLGNLFLTDKLEVRIGDFGLAAKLDFVGQKRKTMCGTPNYIAPQILENHQGHSYEVDIWSLGVITYAFLIGRPPFETNDVKATYSKIKQCNYSYPDNVGISKVAKNFISKMLQRDPSRRSTIDQILSDQFFTSSLFPKTLPISTLACPPNSNFLRQFSSRDSISSEKYEKYEGSDTLRETFRDNSKTKRNTERDSTGKGLVRANSIQKVDKIQPVQRAASSAALMAGRRILIRPQSKKLYDQPVKIVNPLIWITYSEQNHKFGMCYLLNSNAIGMRFNDSTCLISNHQFTMIKYIDQLSSTTECCQIYPIKEVPDKLSKKLKIITHYHKQLLAKKQAHQGLMTNHQRIQKEKEKHRETTQTAMNHYVVKLVQTPKITIFWYNNKDYQVIFKDLTELFISANKVAYLNKFGDRKYFEVTELQEQPEEIKKRMNYTVSVIEKMRNKNMVKNKQNTQNVIVRSSSVSKVENGGSKVLKASASSVRLLNCRLIK